jgi:hypothetical protein
MKKNYFSILSIAFISCIVFWIFYSMTPHFDFSVNVPMSEFSTNRALEHLKIIAEKPHYVGSQNHKTVANYLETELRDLGLEVKTEDGFSLNDGGVLVKSHNILAKLKGTESGKALMLLSHYDSAPHSKSKGASDDGAGVVAILEGIRSYIHNNTSHKNDIIILFSDAEEVGLNGAAQFVTQSKWAKEVGLVINFEARGTSGPSYMLMEATKGNAALIKSFKAANPKFPVANSLMYSIYKMLPNDTDLTVFREQGKIHGFNFAFIDDHFNYHSAQDDVQHLDKNSLAQQGTYLMPLLKFYADANLSKLETPEDHVYFNTPINFVSYPFSWSLPLVAAALFLFVVLTFAGLAKRVLDVRQIIHGIGLYLFSIIICGAIGFGLWRLVLFIYPQYKDILHGFTYNGHYYLIAFLALSLAINFFIFSKNEITKTPMNYFIAPLMISIVVNFAIVFYLPGAGFFVIPTWFGLAALAHFVLTQKSNLVLQLLFIMPSLILLVPLLVLFPIGLGLKVLFLAIILLTYIFGSIMPIVGGFEHKKTISLAFLAISIGFLIQAHLNADFQFGKAKPNSLVYVQSTDSKEAIWATYDTNLDSWTKNYFGLGKKSTNDIPVIQLKSKYNSGFSFTSDADFKDVASPTIKFLKDSTVRGQRYLKIFIIPNRPVSRYDVFAPEDLEINNFKANSTKAASQKGSLYARKGQNVVRYYVVDNEPLLLEFNVKSNKNIDMEILESSFDLLENPKFNIPKRANWMIPTPFVLTDAVMIKQKLKPTSDKPIAAVAVKKPFVKKRKKQIEEPKIPVVQEVE